MHQCFEFIEVWALCPLKAQPSVVILHIHAAEEEYLGPMMTRTAKALNVACEGHLSAISSYADRCAIRDTNTVVLASGVIFLLDFLLLHKRGP